MKALRFGIVGCGSISHLHAECLKKLAAEGLAELVAAAEIIPERAKEWSRKWNVPVFHSLTQMLAEAKLDVVTVTTPQRLAWRQRGRDRQGWQAHSLRKAAGRAAQ